MSSSGSPHLPATFVNDEQTNNSKLDIMSRVASVTSKGCVNRPSPGRKEFLQRTWRSVCAVCSRLSLALGTAFGQCLWLCLGFQPILAVLLQQEPLLLSGNLGRKLLVNIRPSRVFVKGFEPLLFQLFLGSNSTPNKLEWNVHWRTVLQILYSMA